MQPTTSTDELTPEQATAVARVLAEITRAWADPHRRDAIRQLITLGPGDAHEDIRVLYAARAALETRAA